MIKIHKLAALLILTICSCQQIEEQRLSLTSKLFNEGIPVVGITHLKELDPNCKNKNCAVIEVNYPVFKSQPLLNQRIESILIKEIEGFLPSGGSAKTINDFMKLFIQSYVVFKDQFPESKTPWFLEIEIKTNYNDSGWLSFASTTKSYTGGVRTNEWLRYINTDTLGRTIAIEDKIGDLSKLRKQGETIFRNQNQLTPDTRLSAAGYTFKNDRFHLPENIGSNDTHILLHYNNYEIGDNIQGAILIQIPYTSVPDISELPYYEDIIMFYEDFLNWWSNQSWTPKRI